MDILSNLAEAPRADPHAGCCGGWGLNTPGYPIRAHIHDAYHQSGHHGRTLFSNQVLKVSLAFVSHFVGRRVESRKQNDFGKTHSASLQRINPSVLRYTRIRLPFLRSRRPCGTK
jgi:hypothetical protein